MADQRRREQEDKQRFQQYLEGCMTTTIASHQSKMEQQFAKQMADMQAFLQGTIASKDEELARAQVAIGKAQAESRDAAAQINAETAAARAWQNKADTAARDLENINAQRARDAEVARKAQDDAVCQAALRVEARHAVDIQALEVKAERYHDMELDAVRQELTETTAALQRSSTSPQDPPPPCPQCPVRQSTIETLRLQISDLDNKVKQEQHEKVALQDQHAKADAALQQDREADG